ncbi:tetraacyldisaccharide 4'-kinase [Aureimonas sp. Leaf454]|uniref:tetraacyldisaccharide 4'-kinase n=1 Tax=Aureimonas sp. Leaf454 TaxID=1736381 RepID=UPI0006F99FBD|nr:tetraacyldisaccharide 4'-kinase [Aureimonas sp. Leaf454]KQT54822.1 tetraacyldisaccharide 4'-kinase [Aureimonas sp. Leaf454]
MKAEAPDFWWREPGWPSALLAAPAAAYGAVARWRLDHGERAEAGLPVLCVGNFTVGGGGKTPTALALGRCAIDLGLKPGFLSRGHGGAARNAMIVDPERHRAGLVGDEPMLLAALAPTAIAADRKRGAALLRAAGADLVIMDDGFQSARLRPDLALLVVDAERGIGNGRVLPAGPLRAPLVDQVRHADAVLLVGEGEAGGLAVRSAARAGKPIHEARIVPRDAGRFAGLKVLAFAGIADPDKFYRTLQAIGAEVAATADYPDHHPLSDDEIADLRRSADREGLTLATTRKDAARLAGGGPAACGFAGDVEVLDIDLVFEPQALGERLIRQTIDAFKARHLR